MSEINYQALREAAEKATCGEWSLEYGESRFDCDDALIHREVAGYLPICRIEGAHPESGFDEDFQMEQQANAEFIAAANPATVLALLDERERNQQYIKRRDQENEDIALTVGKLRVELEGKDSKIANLTAERDALREGEMGDARHSNTRAAADIYFQLVEECEIPAGGSLVEYVDDMREKLEAAEKRIAELEAEPVSQTCKLNEPSGNSPVTPDGWISCSDRMPEDTKMLLAFSQGEIVAAYWNWVVNPIDYKKYRAFTYLSGNILDDVTHWMPLPEPPQEVNRG
ncbi:TPA: ead/Ea22-like family protein [Escherichia coli]|nr:ead/Ea22-like family protein [Escherichia coli]